MGERDRIRELLLRYQNADPESFEDLYRLLSDRLYRFLLKRCRSATEAEDALQETFFRIHKYILGYRAEFSGYAWIFMIAQNVFLKSRRGHHGRTHESLSDDFASSQPDSERHVVAVELLTELFRDLTEAERQLIIGRLMDEKEYETLAKELATTPSSVRQRLSRALRRLRKRDE